jgi:hypothetical protein
MKTAKSNGYQVFISPHYYFHTDHSWQFGGTVENIRPLGCHWQWNKGPAFTYTLWSEEILRPQL